MNHTVKNDILIISESTLEAKRLKEELKNNIGGCVATSGTKALEMIKHYPDFSDIFIPLDLEDMDYSDFIKFAKRQSPNSNYILISPLNYQIWIGWYMAKILMATFKNLCPF